MRKPRAPRIVTVSILTTITIIFWVFYGLYNLLVSRPDLDVPAELLTPINPSLDKEILNKIQSRIFFEQSSDFHIPPDVLGSPTSEPDITIPLENGALEEGIQTEVPINPEVEEE